MLARLISIAPLAIALTAFALTGCASGVALTDEGTLVHHAEDADLPMGCTLLGDVPIGIPPDGARPATEEELVVLMRNKSGEHGGTHVVIDMKEQRGESEESRYWIGRGRAYRCPAPDATVVGADEGGDDESETSGGEEEIDDTFGEGGGDQSPATEDDLDI